MKICAISPFDIATTEELLKFLSGCKHDLLVLPGNSDNHPTHIQVGKILKPGVQAFVETGHSKRNLTPWLVSQNNIIKMPQQMFIKRPSASDLDSLQSAWSKRTYKIADRSVSFAICGEIDAYTVNGEVKNGRHLPFDILVNPTHTIRGRWNHLGQKLEALSRNTIVVHVANNSYNKSQITTNIRVYKDGQVMKQEQEGNITWSECEI